MAKMPVIKQFELSRMPFYRNNPADRSSMTTMMFDPGSETKTVTAANRDDLLAQMRAFGAELGRACMIKQKHVGRGPGFMKLPWQVTCCEDNTPNEEFGHHICNEHLERIREERARPVMSEEEYDRERQRLRAVYGR
jgi:hypothetical protein